MSSEPGKVEGCGGPEIVGRTFAFGVCVVKFCRTAGRTAGSERSLINQLLRSGTSIGANIEEGQAAQSRKDFISKNQIALKEARETVYWLRLMVGSGMSTTEAAAPLIREAVEICRILGAIVVRAKRNLEAGA